MFRITTDQLYLREFQKSDAKDLYFLNSDPEVLKYTGDIAFLSEAETESFIEAYDHYKNFKMGRWAVILKDSNDFVGWCGLKHNEDGKIDLGYRLKKAYWGKGLATQASIACLDYGFNSLFLDKIIGRTSIHNIAGQKVLEKCGFQKKGMFDYGEIGPSYYYELLKSEFKS